MNDDIITPEIVETIDYALRETQLLQQISIDLHILVLITIMVCGCLIAYIICRIIKSVLWSSIF